MEVPPNPASTSIERALGPEETLSAVNFLTRISPAIFYLYYENTGTLIACDGRIIIAFPYSLFNLCGILHVRTGKRPPGLDSRLCRRGRRNKNGMQKHVDGRIHCYSDSNDGVDEHSDALQISFTANDLMLSDYGGSIPRARAIRRLIPCLVALLARVLYWTLQEQRFRCIFGLAKPPV